MNAVFLCDAVRTPIGRYGGVLASVRADDLAAIPIRALMERNPAADWTMLDDVILGCANQAGEDNRNIARMALLLAGLPDAIPGVTVNRLCGSGLDAVGTAARAIAAGEMDFVIAGGAESMSRAPFVIGKAEMPFQRQTEIFDTTMGWRFVNPQMRARYGIETMPETGENVARDFKISREAQDAFAYRSQTRTSEGAEGWVLHRGDYSRRSERPEDFLAGNLRRASAPGHDPGCTCKAEAASPVGNGHRRKRIGHQ